jgi:polyketide synthase PksN
VADASGSAGRDIDVSAPFGELGIDSFRVLKIIKALESDFGVLPKTLLFENFNVESLARYFVDKHGQVLQAMFAKETGTTSSAQPPAPVRAATAPAATVGGSASAPRLPVAKTPVRLLEQDLPQHPELQSIVAGLFDRHKNEGCVSRGTRNIAPNLFIGSARKGYFNYSRSGNIILVYAYTGPADYFSEIATEMYRYCVDKGFQLNIFVDDLVGAIDGVEFSATPFGALQRVLNIKEFTLEGGPMRRLRYQVSKFEKAGACRTVEYKCGTDSATDRSIADVIDLWCSTKTMVNPLIHIVREEILAGSLHPQHRIFLTYVDDTLQNVILISRMSEELNGYLMDLEFYGREMPLGGLEYAIVKIIEQLASEGCDMLSMGGTYGCRLESSPHADPEVDRILDDLHRQNIFNDEGNLQFKNKFRCENRTIYLCRPVGSGKADNVIDIIMMIADPAKANTSDAENHNAVAAEAPAPAAVMPDAAGCAIDGMARSHTLAQHGFNPLNIPSGQIEFDLKTDSWAQLDTPFVDKQMRHLRAQLQQPVSIEDTLALVFPFRHVLLLDAGRTSDRVFCKAWPSKGVVLQNLLFPTSLYHQIDNGFVPCELPHPGVFQLDSEEGFKGNLDWNALEQQVASRAKEIAYVCVDLSNNGAGGQPVSLQHLRKVKELLGRHEIALVIDATRVLENALAIIARESEHAGRTVWEVARDILSCADAVIGSLAKDFCVNKGGIIATNDEALLRRCQDVVAHEGGGLDAIDRKLVALSLTNRRHLETQVRRRMDAAALVWQVLKDARVPVVHPAGLHCVLVDVKRLPEFAGFADPVASFLAWLYLNTGIRAGAHSVGMQKGTAINALVRLAIPVGLKREQAADLAQRLAGLFAEMNNIPELAASGAAAESFVDVHANYSLVRYHRPSGALVEAHPPATPSQSAPAQPVAATPETAPAVAPGQPVRAERTQAEIAVVGMAGRYPKARDLDEFWDNLRQGRDCVGDMPEERLARRAQNRAAQDYRGGFLDDIDRFDSLFFNISPREAEVLDPQERLFLEVAWETLEDAGYYPEILARDNAPRSVGVFVGAVWAMYQMVGVEEKLKGNEVNPNSFLWSIANRVSYWMNLTGPSMTVDTACSSSLTAVHLACEAIRNGDCVSAIAGGVNLDLHQHKFDINWAGGALSPDGVCRTFGAGANGYVAGEGVGALYLKRLDQALADNDHIYGVVKSAVVNHGGRTSGYTVPNPKAQGELVALALHKARVDPRTIGYVEAHGTGTELGDPIEISGLNNAFASSGAPAGSCAIGSVKTNIGHLEAAAGVVGMCKVLLQMKYRQLVPSLHCEEPNAYIDFDSSPFRVQQRLAPWLERDVDGVRVPLRAGVSSFGAGGANAHVVLERYELAEIEPAAPEGGYVFPLSARNEEQLRQMALRLRAHLQRDFIGQRANDVAFTLQNGRKCFDHRLAIVAASIEELVAKLGLYLDGAKNGDILAGHARNAEGVTKLLSRQEQDQFVALLAQSREPHKLAQLWIDGLLPDCRGLSRAPGRRTALPTYPFADKRHWIGSAAGASAAPAVQGQAAMHPLIDSNESTFQRQLFKKTFHAREFFLRDHLVSGVPTLPGTAYLDMARKAGEVAAGRKVRAIRNVTWVSPLAVNGSDVLEACVELKPSGDAVLFEVFSETPEGTRRLYAQGKLMYANGQGAEADEEFLDIAAIRARCTTSIAAGEAYPLFGSLGMHYGPSFQVLSAVHKNANEVLGALVIPDLRSGDFDQFVLHPCILDAAMQAGVMAQLADPSGEMKVPYSIGEVEILHPLTRTCYSYVTKADGERNASATVSRENVTIVDESGKVLARIRDAVGVPLVNVHEKPAPARKDDFDTLYYSHVWRSAPLADMPADAGSILIFDRDERLLQACSQRGIDAVVVMPGEGFEARGERAYVIDPAKREDYARLFSVLSQSGWQAQKVCFAWPSGAAVPDRDTLAQALADGVYAFLYLCQALIEQKPAGKLQLLYLYGAQPDGAQPHDEAINGFVRSLRLENPKLECKVLEMPHERAAPPALLETILAELHASAQDDITVRYADGERAVRTLRKIELPEADTTGGAAPLKQDGVYLITGGAGGLGLMFAEFLARQCRARLVLTGRSALAADRQGQLDALRELGAEVLYIAADVAQADEVRRVLEQARSRFGGIDGIVHSAGVLRDSFLRKKTPEDMQAVFAAKIFGTFHLDEQTRGDDLDFFVTFSSLAAIGGNTGQCDYAYANHYMDAFAARREAQRAAGKRSGRTVSLNWSLWADGGMKLDEQTEIFFRKNLGIRPLGKDVGLRAFASALRSELPQVAVLEGVQAKIEQAWGLVKKEAGPAAASVAIPAAAPAVAPAAPTQASGKDLVGAVTQELAKIAMELLKLGADDLALDSILLDLGFDSIGLATFANAINDRYGLDINPVLFFEYPSIIAIAGVLAEEHADAVRKVHQGAVRAAAQPAARPAPAAVASDSVPQFAITKHWEPNQAPAAGGQVTLENRFASMPIAIVGIAGVMPQSDDLQSFWDNLKNERNLVTEIPRDRWIWEDYDGNPLKEPNKSYSRWGGFMNEVDKFDPLFFGITPREAEMMDPQQRIFIETVWRAVEDAGHKVSDLSGTRTGLFVGVSAQDYIDVLAEHSSALDGYSASGNSHSILANRVSYLLNLRGPSAPIDTACSSSLIALHRAVESIHTGSSEMAIVGGVQVMLTPIAHISLSAAGMLSTDGKCKTFNKDANGYVRGEGAGAVFIKPLARAQADGNHIYAVIRGSAENHGGKVTNLTAPNPKAQAELLVEAYEKAQIDPSTVGYIECHGTGTSLGDPIEVQALKKAFSDLYRKHDKATPAAPHCGLSSVKSNIGHLEPAAGIASLLKVLLAIRHKQIPALLHFEELNPYIDLKDSPFYIVDKTVPWQGAVAADGSVLPRRAGISSFGWGGANAHIVLEEYLPAQREPRDSNDALPIVLSAKNAERLKAYAHALAVHLSQNEVDFGEFAYTLQAGRDTMHERLGFIAASSAEAIAQLSAFADADGATEGVYQGRVGRKTDDLSVIGQDADIRESVVRQLIEGRKWERLLELWVKGMDVDWGALDAAGTRNRISLPSYPFARERYWIDTSAKAPKAQPAPRRDEPVPETARQLLFEEYWEPQAAPDTQPLARDRRTVIFADESIRKLLATAQDAGQLAEAVLVYPAESFEKVSEQVYRCPMDDIEGLRQLLAQVRVAPGQSLGLVYAWSRNRKQAGVHGLFKLFTAIKECAQPVAHVALVGAYDPADADTCWDYSWIGFERSLKLYLAKTRISLLYTGRDPLTVPQLLDATSRTGTAWYDGGQRLALASRPLAALAAPQQPLLKEGGGYLITGGAGALGLKLAHQLAQQYQARLLLVGRRAPTPEIERELEALVRAGAREARYCPLDLGDSGATRAWAADLPFPLSGVVHAAGVESEQPFFEKSAADIDQVLHPKTVGSQALQHALADQDLDFVCHFSSSSALLGDFGSCDYAVANRFQMAYARHLQQGGQENGRTVVINWPLWEEGGMGVSDPAQAALYLKRTGLEALRTPDGLALWHQLLGAPQRQTLVMVGQPARVDSLLERIYRPQQAGRKPGAGKDQARLDQFISAIKARSRHPGGLDTHQLDKLRQWIKADLVSFHGTEE